ncbi:hypothetical protein FVE85_2156 [Porphyridium purpureum]|uniref:Uncharacterized protein n=1 Tax=Porphyridium purpureum TaxID=35688 RepID=A0A5J4YWR6_PORPP|nr:hypothetical protein FVE85_2156 [Porphyridium purpureum]|eukprot:POR6480..scf209_3
MKVSVCVLVVGLSLLAYAEGLWAVPVVRQVDSDAQTAIRQLRGGANERNAAHSPPLRYAMRENTIRISAEEVQGVLGSNIADAATNTNLIVSNPCLDDEKYCQCRELATPSAEMCSRPFVTSTLPSICRFEHCETHQCSCALFPGEKAMFCSKAAWSTHIMLGDEGFPKDTFYCTASSGSSSESDSMRVFVNYLSMRNPHQ